MKADWVLTGPLAVILLVAVEGSQIRKEIPEYIGDMTSEDIAVRERAAQAILQNRQDTRKALEDIVKGFLSDETRKGTVKTAIVVLGKLRSAESVPLLGKNLTFSAFYKDTKRTQPPEDYFPCVGALIDIGNAAIPQMIDNIQTTDDKTMRELSARVIRSIEGPKVGRILIEDAIEKQADPAKRANLEAALALEYFASRLDK